MLRLFYDMKKEIITEFERRVFKESFARIIQCLDRLTEEQTWHQPGPQTNSVGVLIVHLLGNAQQWICTTFGDFQDNRNRSAEFEANQELNQADLKRAMTEVKQRIAYTLNELNEEDLYKQFDVQCYQESGLSILIHVIEHFSYHTGQIALLTKLQTTKDLGFYANDEVDKTQ